MKRELALPHLGAFSGSMRRLAGSKEEAIAMLEAEYGKEKQ